MLVQDLAAICTVTTLLCCLVGPAHSENIFSSIAHAFDSKPKNNGNSNGQGNANPRPAPDNQRPPSGMNVEDGNSESVSDSPGTKTEPRGDDFAKMVAGAIKSMMEYESVKKNAATDTRPLFVTYDGLGTFYRNGSTNNLNKLPMTPEQVGTKFMLYTSPNQVTPDILDYNNPQSFQQSRFQPQLPTVVITHGFKTSKGAAGLQWVMLFVNALFRRQGPGNYIVVDWSNGAQSPDYWMAAANTQLVGAQLAKVIRMLRSPLQASSSFLQRCSTSDPIRVEETAKRRSHIGSMQKETVIWTLLAIPKNSPFAAYQGKGGCEPACQIKGAPISSFSLMGFSLGSHVSGFAGKRLGNAGKLMRIFGIDAAGPMFEHADPGGRLSKGDAAFVVAEHGSADGLKNGGLGIWQQLGDVDFYANGGREQPGCGNMVSAAVNQLLKLNFKGIPEAVRCNHDRNWMYVLQTFDPQCQFQATACDTFGHVQNGRCGEQVNDRDQAMGVFAQNQPSAAPLFFDTVSGAVEKSACPYHLKVVIQSAKQALTTRGNFDISFVDNNGAESKPFIIAQDGRVPAGKQAFLLVRSPFLPSTIRKMKVTFHKLCDQTTCNADVVNLQSVTIANINNDLIMSYCGGGDLVSEQTKTMDMQSGLCGKHGGAGGILTSIIRGVVKFLF